MTLFKEIETATKEDLFLMIDRRKDFLQRTEEILERNKKNGISDNYAYSIRDNVKREIEIIIKKLYNEKSY